MILKWSQKFNKILLTFWIRFINFLIRICNRVLTLLYFPFFFVFFFYFHTLSLSLHRIHFICKQQNAFFSLLRVVVVSFSLSLSFPIRLYHLKSARYHYVCKEQGTRPKKPIRLTSFFLSALKWTYVIFNQHRKLDVSLWRNFSAYDNCVYGVIIDIVCISSKYDGRRWREWGEMKMSQWRMILQRRYSLLVRIRNSVG